MLDEPDLGAVDADAVVVRTFVPAEPGRSSLNHVVAVLAGLALLCCSWWMVDRNNADREGEVSLELVAAAPTGNSGPVTVLETGGTEDRPGVVVGQFTDAARIVVSSQTGSCAGLPAVGRSLKPAPYWVLINLPDGTLACRLDGHWQLRDLLGQVDNDLSVSESQGRLKLEYRPATQPASFRVVDFDLRVQFPAEVDSADRAASVSGNSAHWAGAEVLRSGAPLTASSRVLPLARASAPWVVGALALLLVAAGIFWPSAPARPTAARFDTAVERTELPQAPPPSNAKLPPHEPVTADRPRPQQPMAPAHEL